MDIRSVILLAAASLLPVVAAALLYVLTKKTPFGKLSRNIRGVIYGTVFGIIAIIGTEYGIPMNGAVVNCRDGAVLTAGLLFGAPAGIIAGIIGGVERWLCVYWGVGAFTRVACSVSTILAGIYAALLRRYMFEERRPTWPLAFAVGVVMEVFHLTMVFITNMANAAEALAVVETCSIPMIIANGLSVMLATAVLTLIGRDKLFKKTRETTISQTIQRWLLITLAIAFVVTSLFIFRLQNEMARRQTDELLDIAIAETAADIGDASDKQILAEAHMIASELSKYDINLLAEKYDVAEIDVVNSFGIITKSTNPDFVGFDMNSGVQSSEFMCLLSDTAEYVQAYGPISYDHTISRKYAGVKTATGFVQIGYDASQFQSDIDSQVVGATKNRHVGQSGFILIVNGDMKVVSAPDSIDREAVESGIGSSAITAKEGETFSLTIDGKPYFCRYATSEGYYIASAQSEDEAFRMRNVALYVNSFLEILIFAVMFALIYSLIRTVVVDKIKSINGSLAQISSGDLDVVVDVRSNKEFSALSDDINTTVDTLKHYIDEASRRIDKELEFAKNIQASALPSTFPAFPRRKDFDIFASMNPAKEVGGDFYDFYMTDSDHLNFLIADVSGKGIPAAMFMMRAKTELKSLTEAGTEISDVFTRGNEALCEGNDAGMFVTAWQGGIDLTSGTVRFANAGHNPPLVMRNGKFEYLKLKKGFVLAGMDGIKYKPQELMLEPGDVIYLYTDGVTEATNENSELFGEERLLDAINSRKFYDVKEICVFIKKKVDEFVGDAPQFDDITMVGLKYIGTPPPPSISFDEAKLSDITAVTEFVEGELEKIGCPIKTVIQFNVAVDELFSNIVRYGYKDKAGPAKVEVIVKEDPRSVSLRFTDSGVPYNPLIKEDPDITLSAEQRGIGGLGIYMVKKSMDDMRYAYENEENKLTITKYL